MAKLSIQVTMKPRTIGSLRKLRPAVRNPSEAVLASLSADQRECVERLLSEPYECVFHPDFGHMRDWVDQPAEIASAPKVSSATPETLVHAGPAKTEVLSAEEERRLFYRFNYGRYRVLRLLHRHRGQRLGVRAARELLRWENFAQETRADIIRANTSLVLAMARRSRNSGVELTELISEGNLALLRCVDKFDASRGFKFSTYACRAILASFSRATAKSARFRAHFPAAYDPAVERSDYLDRKRERVELECVDELREILFENKADLSSVERRVLDARFSLGKLESQGPARRRTLDQVGMLLGVSKERVRQIQNQAMDKLRAVLEQRLLAAS
jgi:RNA polymerase primary sigma factor